jgi:hypothetical protein
LWLKTLVQRSPDFVPLCPRFRAWRRNRRYPRQYGPGSLRHGIKVTRFHWP